ncbi:hypothetical protein LBMAG44_03850 [Gemmatimonadota bacterium]|nr:hypothetical protein LBMAG44_03850 [Gemmatimonadota bacterium]
MSRPLRFLAPAALALMLACGRSATDPGGIVCTTEARAAINLAIVDSLTGAAAAFTGLWGRAVDGAYRDSSAFAFVNPQTGAVTLGLAYEHAGTLAVTVHANGYRDWQKSVVVTKDVCHVIGVQLTARLAK